VRSKLRGITFCVLAALAMASRSAAQSQPSSPLNSYEQAAIKVVSDWTAAWQAKDPDKMAQYMADDINFSGDPSNVTMRMGRQAYMCVMRQLVNDLLIKDVSYQAVGDKVYTLVIQRRTDVVQAPPGGGRRGGADGAGRAAGPPPGLAGDLAVAGFFVVKNGKIVEWMDVTLAIDVTTLQRGGGPAGRQGGGQVGCN